MATLYILCGPSGSGKSTWATNFVKNKRIAYISRDNIRLSIIKEEEDYFSHEKEVFREFVRRIVEVMTNGHDCIADATHLNEFSRRKLTQAIDMHTTDYKIIYVVFNASADTCVDLNMFSRCKLIQALDMYTRDYDIIFVVFNTDVETCVERNKTREGRRNVPENIIRNMCRDFRAPTLDEDERAKEIIEV